MKKILRVCSYPTSKFESMGMNSYIISGMKSVKTIFITPRYPGVLFPTPQNCSVIAFPFIITPAPSGFLRIFHEIKRIFIIFIFSFNSISVLIKEKPDIVHIHSPMFFLIALFAKLQRKHCFITYHGNEYKIIYDNFLLGIIFNKIFTKTFALSSSILSYSERFENYKDNFVSIYNSVNTKIFFNRNLSRSKLVISVGRLEKQKDYTSLLKAFAKLNSISPDYKLYIVGTGSLENNLKNLSINLGIENSVKFFGKVSHEELCSLYNYSEIFVLSSLWEGFPKVLLEAIACGCKVVATRVDAVPEILGFDYPFLVDPSDIDDLFNKMRAALNYKSDFHTRYCSIIERYSWETLINMMEEEYNRL